MARFKNYKNPVNNSDSIYSAEDFFNMSLNNISDNLDILNAQDRTIGIPYNEELQSSPNTVYVDSYTRADGTPVQAHWRSKSDGQGAYGQIQTTPNYTNSQPINTASFVDDTLNMPTNINDNVQTQRPQQGQNLYKQNPMPVFNTGVGQMNNPTLANYGQSFDNAQPTLANFGKQLSNTQPTLANFDNQFMNEVGNQTQNSTYKEINDAICQLMSGKPKQECSPEYIKHMNEMVTQAVTGTPKQKYSPEDIAYMNKKIIQEINSYYEPPKVSEKENTEKFMNVFTRSILSQMIKDAQNSSKIVNGTETGYAVDIPKENNTESFVGNEAQSESTLSSNESLNGVDNSQNIKEVASKTLFGGISEDYNLPSTITQNKAIDDVNKNSLPNIYVDDKGNIVASDDKEEYYQENFVLKFLKSFLRNRNEEKNSNYPFAKEALDISTKSPKYLRNTKEYVVANSKDKEILKSKNIAFDNDKNTLIFTPQSSAVQAVKESKDFRNVLKKWFDGETLDGQVRPQKFSVILADNPNIFRSIHGATVRNVRDNGDGTVSCELTDFYDFKYLKDKISKDISLLFDNYQKYLTNNKLGVVNFSKQTSYLFKNLYRLSKEEKHIDPIILDNNRAYFAQQLHVLTNYNIVIPITIDKKYIFGK